MKNSNLRNDYKMFGYMTQQIEEAIIKYKMHIR